MNLITTTYDPATHKIVPIEPTEEQIRAACLRQCTDPEISTYEEWAEAHSNRVVDEIRKLETATYIEMVKAAPAAPSGWQPIESAPDGVMLLFADMNAGEAKNWAHVGWRHSYLKSGFVQSPDNKNRTATHWMPLPTPPAP